MRSIPATLHFITVSFISLIIAFALISANPFAGIAAYSIVATYAVR